MVHGGLGTSFNNLGTPHTKHHSLCTHTMALTLTVSNTAPLTLLSVPLCVMGVIDQVRSLCRPIVDGASVSEPLGQLLRDVLWSDPTDSDNILGVHDRSQHTTTHSSQKTKGQGCDGWG